jgi:hypothetical protein
VSLRQCGLAHLVLTYAALALVDHNIEETRYIPASPDSDGLSFMLVRIKGKTYVIRYPGVCI